MYSYLGGSSNGILIRDPLNAGGIMCFSWCSLVVLAGGELLPTAYWWILLTRSVVMATVHRHIQHEYCSIMHFMDTINAWLSVSSQGLLLLVTMLINFLCSSCSCLSVISNKHITLQNHQNSIHLLILQFQEEVTMSTPHENFVIHKRFERFPGDLNNGSNVLQIPDTSANYSIRGICPYRMKTLETGVEHSQHHDNFRDSY
jgi:hypothetical protein